MKQETYIIKEFIDALIYNPDTCNLSKLTDDCEIHVSLGNQLFTDSYSATFIGKNGVMNFVKSWRSFLSETEINYHEFNSEKAKIIARGDFSCRLALSENTWSANWMQICSFKGEKIQKIRIFSDFRPASAATTEVQERTFQQQAETSLTPFLRR